MPTWRSDAHPDAQLADPPLRSTRRRALRSGGRAVIGTVALSLAAGCGGGSADADVWCAALLALGTHEPGSIEPGERGDWFRVALEPRPGVFDVDDGAAWSAARAEYDATVRRVDEELQELCPRMAALDARDPG